MILFFRRLVLLYVRSLLRQSLVIWNTSCFYACSCIYQAEVDMQCGNMRIYEQINCVRIYIFIYKDLQANVMCNSICEYLEYT